MNSKLPKISVILPVYNGSEYLAPAIDSVLAQTFDDFELIIIDDGSTDGSGNIIRGFATDKRVKLLYNEKNLGLVGTLNRGISAARGEYIARMDQDDICYPERLEKQYVFMNDRQDVGVVGTGIILMNGAGDTFDKRAKPAEHYLIKWRCFFSVPIFHPTVIARADILKNNPYDQNFEYCEDIELWSRLIFKKNIEFANLPDYLLRYRIHGASMTKIRTNDQAIKSAQIKINNIKNFIFLSAEAKRALNNYLMGNNTAKELFLVQKIYTNLLEKYAAIEKLNERQKQTIVRSLKFHKFFLNNLINWVKRKLR
ncbi:MAG: glycosyltransferase [Candidatus Falkowbacteria bacterium]